jgi:hypothetical protein
MDVTIRSMQDADLAAADHIVRLAFGTFLGMPDPAQFMGDAGFVRSRFKADPTAAFIAELQGEVVASNFATRWGSVGFFGPLTVRPDLWDRGIAKLLLDPVMEKFVEWRCTHRGLFTFAHSPKHIGLYQRYDFWPRFLTAIMGKPITSGKAPDGRWRLSEVPPDERSAIYSACRELTDELYEGLDARVEVQAIVEQGLGDTVLLWNGSKLVGFAACHMGPHTEAGSGNCYIKFGAVRAGAHAIADLGRLLDACEALGAAAQCKVLIAGANIGRIDQYRAMLAEGFRANFIGVVMEHQAKPGYNRSDVVIIDDWR